MTRIGVANRWSLPPRKPAILLALALAAGAVDAASYLGLGHVFTANMTGNTVLLGIAVAHHDGAGAARSATALGGFALGAAAGFGLLRADGGWPARAKGVLWLEGLVLALLLVVWSDAGAAPARFWLIVMSAIAMGAQSAAVRASDVKGVNTTYMTSTLINVIARIVLKARGVREGRAGPALPGSAWSVYAVGALVGALAEQAWHSTSVTIPLAILCVVAGAATWAR